MVTCLIIYTPQRSDQSLLAQFYFADEELNHVAAELDSFEGKGYPEKCAVLVNQLRACQARVLNVVSQMMDESIKDQRALRDFRVKFPDDLCQENLAGQLWFGAEVNLCDLFYRFIPSSCQFVVVVFFFSDPRIRIVSHSHVILYI